MDTIYLRGLKVETIIGIYDWERSLKRPLIFDVALETDLRPAAATDKMQDSIDYAAVRDTVVELAQSLQPQLLETLAEKIADALFERFPVETVQLSIDKPGAVADVQGVGVRIERRRLA